MGGGGWKESSVALPPQSHVLIPSGPSGSFKHSLLPVIRKIAGEALQTKEAFLLLKKTKLGLEEDQSTEEVKEEEKINPFPQFLLR